MPSALPKGTWINDRYRLGDRLGSGQSAVVYEAWDEHLHREVAIKLLDPTGGVPATWHEARVLEQLRSDYLLPVLNADVITESDIRYIATPIMRNGDLESVAEDVGVCATRAVAWGTQLARGLQRVHDAGLLHRDVKPGNAFVNKDGSVLLADLGKAVTFTLGTPAPRDGSWVTLAPETAPDNGGCSIASDVYALGATVFYLLAGCYPVDHRLGPSELQAAILAGRRRKLLDVAPHISRSLRGIVETAMAADPTERYSSALEFGNALAGASLYARDWERHLHHTGHQFCINGKANGTSGAVSICAIAADTRIQIRARLASGRRPPGLPDQLVRPRDLGKALRALTAELG